MMAGRNRTRRKQSLHRMLIKRLLLVAAVVSIVVAGLVVQNERGRVLNVAADRALVGRDVLTLLLREQLDGPGLGNQRTIS